MVRIFIALIGLFSLLATQTSFAYVAVTATVDKNPVVVTESFVLTVTADDDINTNALDTSPLMQDFIVGRTSVSSQTSMVNFKTTRTTTWSTVLIAREAGVITIPALSVDSAVTKPIKLNVLAASDPQANKQQDLFIITDISAKEVYVQQQLTLTVKLHFAAELKRGSLTEPSLTGANITQIGKDKEADSIINGRRYRVIERTYAISPQQSGSFTLKSP
ncbi:MAG: BatD family protein, partial [Thalassotalea sp.]|nr:BatD family protein [Thalassotalea sp.]